MATRLAPARRTALATLLLLLTAGTGFDPARAQTSETSDRATALHVLNRVTFGPRPGDVDRVAQLGVERYLEQQLAPQKLDDSRLEARLSAFETIGMSTDDLADKYFRPAMEAQRARQRAAGAQTAEMPAPAPVKPQATAALAGQRTVINELMQARMLRAVESERQLQEVLVDFWFNHFNVFVGKGQVRQYLTEYERDVIRPNVLGSFRTLLGKVAHSPAMLFYLDNWQSASPNVADPNPDLTRRLNDSRLTPEQRQRLTARLQQLRTQMPRQNRGINENYARELMELHTLGVEGGYTQQDVVELARIFTGWTIDQPRMGGQFVFRTNMHDNGAKTLLGTTFGPAGETEGEQALDLLAAHPATARHIAFKLAQRFVADEPPTVLVDRVARVFVETKGDLRAVTRAIVTSPEFLGAEYRRAKVKTPLEFVASAIRATGATVTSAQPLVTALQNLGMPLYGSQPPTGYDGAASAWVNTGALVARLNFAVDIVSTGRIAPQQTNGRGGRPAPADQPMPAGRPARRLQPGRAVQIDIDGLASDVSSGSRDRVVDALLGVPIAESTTQTLARAQSPQQLIALTLGSPEFQKR